MEKIEKNEIQSEKKFSVKNSISLINVRTEALIDFCRFMSLLAVMKVNGDKIEGHPIVKKLIFLKTFLARLKPINKKIEYQIGKLIRISMKVRNLNPKKIQKSPIKFFSTKKKIKNPLENLKKKLPSKILK